MGDAVTPSRRDFVAMLLGAPAAAALGCRAPRRAIDATLVDTGMARGHAAVRDVAGGDVRIPDGRTRRARVVIVGGGVAGLAAGWWLDRLGVRDWLLVELDEVAGGTARGGASAVTPYPWGAHYIVAPQAHQHALIALCGDLGLVDPAAPPAPDGAPVIAEEHRCAEPEERVWYRGRWYEGLYLHAGASADDHAQLAAYLAELDRWVAWRDARGRRAFTLPVAACSDEPEVLALDAISATAWLDARGLTSPRLRWLVDYGCRDDYGLTADDTSAWAALLYAASRMTGPGAEPQGVITAPDGNGHLIARLAARAGARLITGAAVVDVAERAGAAGAAVRVTALAADGPLALDADAAIVATPRHVARRIVAPLRAAPDAYVPDVGAWAVANLHLRDRPAERRRDAPPAWDNVLYDSPSLGYVTATHQRGRAHGPTVLTWYYPLTDPDAPAARRRVAAATAADWAEVALADLERGHPGLRALVDHVEVAFWGHGMVRPRVGAIASPARRAAARPHGRISFAHTDLSGVALFEEALDHAVRAAAEVARVIG